MHCSQGEGAQLSEQQPLSDECIGDLWEQWGPQKYVYLCEFAGRRIANDYPVLKMWLSTMCTRILMDIQGIVLAESTIFLAAACP